MRKADMDYLNDLERQSAMWWLADERAWSANPEQVAAALMKEGFEECKREIARDGRTRTPSGGIWQGSIRGPEPSRR